jgi:hypothetical protein
VILIFGTLPEDYLRWIHLFLKIDELRKQLHDLDIELARSKQETKEYEERLAIRTDELNKYKAVGVDNYTMGECEEMERKLKFTLEMVSQRKVN